jgi:hypothetical protein
MVYKFRSGSGFTGDAQAVYMELEQIREENNGELRPDCVVGRAREEQSALHPHFEWDNEKAAEAYRRWTARHLVRSVVVVPEETTEKSPDARQAFISVKQDTGEGSKRYYQNVEVASRDEFDSALEQFKAKLAQLRRSAIQIERYAKDQEQVAKAQKIHEGVQELENLAR